MEEERDVVTTAGNDGYGGGGSTINDDDEFQSCSSSFQDEQREEDNDQEGNISLHSSPSLLSNNYGDGMLLEQILFFACGLGSSLGYIATLSSLVYFKILYGPNSFVYINLAVYLPLIPISIAQAKWDQVFDQRYQSRRTFLVRGICGFVLNLVGTLALTESSEMMATLIGSAMLQGIGGAILYGTLNQMASFVVVHGNEGRLKAMVSAGIQVSALVVLAVSATTKFAISHNAETFFTFLWIITVIEVICFAMFLLLLLARPSVATSMDRRDSSISLATLDVDIVEEPPLMGDNLEEPLIPRLSSQQQIIELSFADLWRLSRSCCLVLIVVLVPSFLVGSWFTQVQTDWMNLAQVLFYVRIGSDFVGRLATIVVPPKHVACLTWTAALRFVPVILFFWNSGDQMVGNEYSDYFSVILVSIIAFLSGYLVTGCFQLAPGGLPREIRAANLSKQASLLTVFFSLSAIGGLISSFALISIGI